MKSEPIDKKLHTGFLHSQVYSRILERISKALIPFGISIPEWKFLGQLHLHGKVKLNKLADLLSYDPPMVTKVAKKLEKKKLVKREQDLTDERAKLIKITKKGRSLFERIEPRVKNTMLNIFHGINKKELGVYLKVLTRIFKNTQK